MELLRALAAVIDRPDRVPGDLLELLELPGRPDPAAHTHVFTFELPPYASVHLGEEGMLGGEARDRVAGFFRALSATPPAEPDHLVVLLHAAADLADAEAAAADADVVAWHRRARAALLREHLLPWAPAYLAAVADVAVEPYRSWARLAQQVLRHQTGELGAGDDLPAHLAGAAPLADPRADAGEDVAGVLLAPVRTGMVVTRSMLARAADELGLGLRIGERRYVLANLLDQAPSAVLAWLARHAASSSRRHGGELAWSGPSAAFWRDRAAASAALLDDLAGDADAARRAAQGCAPAP